MRLRTLTQEDLSAATSLLRHAWPYDRFCVDVVREKLFEDLPGEGALTLGLSGARGLLGFVCAVTHGKTAWIKLASIPRQEADWRKLLVATAAWARSRDAKVLRLMDHPGNYWTPGLDVRYVEALDLLARWGFDFVVENHSLSCPTQPAGVAPELPAGVHVRRIAPNDVAGVLRLAQRFHAAWAWEIKRALANRPAAVFVAESSARLVAFAAHDANNRSTGAFGPAGTLARYRGRGIGEHLLRACLQDVAKRGLPSVTIPWVSKTSLYDRLGATLLARYHVLSKHLSLGSKTHSAKIR